MLTQKPEQGDPFELFDGKRYMLLTTFRADGTPVTTPMDVYRIGEGLFFVTDGRSGKAKRIRYDPVVTICPSGIRGAPTGPTVHGRVRILGEEEAATARDAFARTHPFVFRIAERRWRDRGAPLMFCEILPANTQRLVS